MKILIVDDNQVLASALREILESQNYMARTAQDGEKAYTTYLDFKPDLVITDIYMPKKNGLELMNDIMRHNPGTKMLLMTSSISTFGALLHQIRKRHHMGILQKPFSIREFLDALERLAKNGANNEVII